MNTTILEGYKVLPYGEEFIAWLEEKHILDAFINRVEERCINEIRSFDYYPCRCKKDVPARYVTLSLWFFRCAEGEQFWHDIHNEWVLLCKERGYVRKRFTFEVYSLHKDKYDIDACTMEDAERACEQYVRDNDLTNLVIGHEFAYVKPIAE